MDTVPTPSLPLYVAVMAIAEAAIAADTAETAAIDNKAFENFFIILPLFIKKC